MKTIELINLFNTLMSLRQDAQRRLKARVSFAIAHNLKLLQPVAQDYDEARLKILQTWGAADPDNPNQYIVLPENMPTVTKELDDLESTEVPLDLVKISISDIEDLDISVQEAEGLELMVEGE